MGKCLNCGEEFLSEIKFCQNCGTANNLDFPDADQYLGHPYKIKRNIFHRMFLVLFDRRVQADICVNNYNGETIFVYFLVLTLGSIPNVLNYLINKSSFPYNQAIVNYYFSYILYALAITSISPFLFAGIALIGNYIADTRNTYLQIFRLLVFLSFPITIINLILNSIYGLLLFQIAQILNVTALVVSLISFFLQILISVVLISFSFKILFDCSYLKALFITLISSLISNAILFAIRIILSPGPPPEAL